MVFVAADPAALLTAAAEEAERQHPGRLPPSAGSGSSQALPARIAVLHWAAAAAVAAALPVRPPEG